MSITARYGMIAVIVVIMLAGCELFVIGGGAKQHVVEISQRTSVGVVYLFKAELDSNNTSAASELVVHATGRKLLAVEKYEMRDDLARWQRLLANKPITGHVTDTVDVSTHTVDATFDHIRRVQFSTKRIEDAWFITRIADRP